MKGLLLVLLSLSLVCGFTLPDVCLCDTTAVAVVSCQARTSKVPMADCLDQGVVVRYNVTIPVTGEGNLTCLCFSGFPAFTDLNGFVATEVSSASWAILYDKLDPTRVIDQYTELEYLYGENAELLLSYKSKDKTLFGTTLRRSVMATGGKQTFWYGFDPMAEALWQD